MYKVIMAIFLAVSITITASAEESKNVLVVRAMTAAINDRNLDALSDFVAQDVVRHSGATPGLIVTNLSEFRAFLENDFATVPDSVQEIDVIFGSIFRSFLYHLGDHVFHFGGDVFGTLFEFCLISV